MEEIVTKQLLEMLHKDEEVRRTLLSQGVLTNDYHPEMEKVHNDNANKLLKIINEFGWPNKKSVGKQASDAAWIIVQHAISLPAFQRKCLLLFKSLSKDGSFELTKVATLEDRIKFFESNLQIYGTQFDWDEFGQLSPLPIQNIEEVETLRQSIGLPSLAQATFEIRARARENNEKAPKNFLDKKRKFEIWLKKVGWRK